MMTKYKISYDNKIIEFATENEAQQYKNKNNIAAEVEIFTEEIIVNTIVPEVVTPRQMRVALILSGILVEDIESVIESLPEPDKSITRITWEYSTEFQRNNPILVAMAPALNLSESDVDQLFILANTL